MLVGRLLLVLLSVLAMAGGASAQCSATDSHFCQTVETTSPDVGTLTLAFTYNSAGTVCTVSAANLQTPCPGNNCGTAQASTVTVNPGSTVSVSLINGHYEATTIQVSFTATYTGGTNPNAAGSSTLSLNGALMSAYGPLARLAFAPFGFTNQQIASVTDQQDNCNSNTFGDPHFTGFGGQKFSVFGKPGGVMNILAASNMQLNARLVQLNDGDSITDAEQQIVKKASSAPLPVTHAFDYPGPYMGELGLATLSGNRLYAKAGHFLSGWAEVRLDDKEWTTIGETVVLGEGADAVAVTRVNLYEITVETRFVHLTISNSDLFFNIENAHLERAFDKQRRPYAGALGQSARLGWQAKEGDAEWQSKMEKECTVESGDLYELTPFKAHASDKQ